MDLMSFQMYNVALIPVVTGLTRVFQMAGVPKRFLPFVSLILGILAGLVYLSGDSWKQGILLGITIGLGASGLYNGVRDTKNGNGIEDKNTK